MILFQGELFDTSNIVVCQYDRISKARNKWKFNLKNGVSLEHSATFNHYSRTPAIVKGNNPLNLVWFK